MTDNEYMVYMLTCDMAELMQLTLAEQPEDEYLQDLSDRVTAIAVQLFNKMRTENEKGDNTKVMSEKPMTLKEKAEQLRRIFGKEILDEINAQIKADNERYLKEHEGE